MGLAGRRGGAAAVLVVVVVALMGGCLKPWLKRLGETPTVRPAQALVGGMVARFDGPQSLVDLAQSVAPANNPLEDFGSGTVEPLRQALLSKGYVLTFDEQRTAALAAVPADPAPPELGQWHHPAASAWTPAQLESAVVDPRDVIAQLARPSSEDAQYFAFVALDINDVGNIFREPIVIVRVTVYDAAATKVLDLRGIGTGHSSFLFADRSLPNLRVAFDEAVASMASVGEEALEALFVVKKVTP